MVKKMKVLHLLRSNRFSGAENVALQIINMFRDDNIEMAYCSRDGQIRDVLSERKVKFFPVSNLSMKEIRRVVREFAPDIIHAHDATASVIAGIATAFFGRCNGVISHMHVNHENMRKVNV